MTALAVFAKLSRVTAGYCRTDKIVGIVATDPSQAFYPFVLLQVLVVAKEVLNLIAHDLREIGIAFNRIVIWI